MKTTAQPIARAIKATRQLSELPAIPTQDWASGVANALVDLSPALVVGVLIAHLDPDEQHAITPISTGIAHAHLAEHPPSHQAIDRALYLQDKLERLGSLGCELPDNAITRGLVAPLSLLHPHAANTPIGRIFASQHLVNPILAIVPITEKLPGFVLIITLASQQVSPAPHTTQPAHPTQSAPSPQNAESLNDTLEILSGLLPLIAHKANLALEQVSNPKAWLTDREHEILDQLILGYSVRVIAANLGRSAHTVHDHVKNLHKKLGASSRGELIAKALGYRPAPEPEQARQNQQSQLGAHPIILIPPPKLSELKPIREPDRPNIQSGSQSGTRPVARPARPLSRPSTHPES